MHDFIRGFVVISQLFAKMFLYIKDVKKKFYV